ncbi:MAG: UDP-N-acetylmuramate dehydrogenase [Candidatus Omnitrophota bacterium]
MNSQALLKNKPYPTNTCNRLLSGRAGRKRNTCEASLACVRGNDFPCLQKYRIKTNVSLKSHTSFRIGGKARYWYEPDNKKELAGFLKTCGNSLSMFVIGCGSNLLIREGLIDKVFIHLRGADFNTIRIRGSRVYVGAGVKISQLLLALKESDLIGYEFLAGIPGTLGGAAVMNAGARCGVVDSCYVEMKDIVRRVEVLDRQGRFHILESCDLDFSYRCSNLKPFIVVGVVLEFKKGDKKAASETIKKLMEYRRQYQDWRYPSAGSFFKNPDFRFSAGQLIDLCCLKGFRVGGAQVSDKHANFILNVGKANSSDVIKIMEKIRQRVYNRFKIKLIPEVEIVS